MKYLVVETYQFPDGFKGEALRKMSPSWVEGSLNLSWRIEGYPTVKWGNIPPEKLQSTIDELRDGGHVFEIEDNGTIQTPVEGKALAA